jgi:hypothetical protein
VDIEARLMKIHYLRKHGGLSLNGLIEFHKLWDALLNFTLTSDEDQHVWKHDIAGSFSAKTTYKGILLWVYSVLTMRHFGNLGHKQNVRCSFGLPKKINAG